jgi:hypothetical protein
MSPLSFNLWLILSLQNKSHMMSLDDFWLVLPRGLKQTFRGWPQDVSSGLAAHTSREMYLVVALLLTLAARCL